MESDGLKLNHFNETNLDAQFLFSCRAILKKDALLPVALSTFAFPSFSPLRVREKRIWSFPIWD